MTPEDWRKVDDVYHAALTHPVAERATFVEVACDGDTDLCREVLSLLARAFARGRLPRTTGAAGAGRPIRRL
jgi:hypothetical protein